MSRIWGLSHRQSTSAFKWDRSTAAAFLLVYSGESRDACSLSEAIVNLAAVTTSYGPSIDGELRAVGAQPDGRDWVIAIEKPDRETRAPHSILALQDAAVATSGDYRHWIEVAGHRLSHTMDPRLGMPLRQSPASVTVVASDCMSADAWATAMMVLGEERGLDLARKLGLSVLFLYHDRQEGAGCGYFAGNI